MNKFTVYGIIKIYFDFIYFILQDLGTRKCYNDESSFSGSRPAAPCEVLAPGDHKGE